MSYNGKNIYELLPAIYRIRDAEQGEPLKALVDIIAGQAQVIQDNIALLYDNWFIETCEEWLVPYIGDLLGVRNFHAIPGLAAVSQRAFVANTLRYRRRKGIAPVLEQLALDTTGWRAHVTEFFELLQTTQYMNHIRLKRPVTPDLRQMNQLDLLNTAFDTIAHSADVRHIASGRGKYNIPNIGLSIWRLQSYQVIRADAFKTFCAPSSPPASPVTPSVSFFTFNPMGYDTQLFNRPKTETSINYISAEINVPGLLRRRALFDELEARRYAIVNGQPPVYNYFNDQPEIEGDPETKRHPVFEIFPNGGDIAVPPEEILIVNLEKCCIPPTEKAYQKVNNDGTFTMVNRDITVAADPVTGRFMFTKPGTVKTAMVSYAYGFSGDIGAGTYNRQTSIPAAFQKLQSGSEGLAPGVWQAGVSKTNPQASISGSIKDAVNLWNNLPAGKTGIITIMDNCSYSEDLDIIIKEKSQLLIIAAVWPERDVPDGLPGEKERLFGDISADNLRPHIAGNIRITGKVTSAGIEKETCGELTLNGLLIQGKVMVQQGCLGAFNLVHSTIVPLTGSLEVKSGTAGKVSNEWLTVSLEQSICGAVDLNKTAAVLFTAEDCILDRDAADNSVIAPEAPVQFIRSTVFGQVRAKTLEAENCIFNDLLEIARRQTGCIRFCYVANDHSEIPRMYRCQPDLEINTAIESASKTGALSTAQKNDITARVRGWLVPAFTAADYKDHGYAQLGNACPVQISSGADDGSEMGVFSYLHQPQRRANLQIALDEYLSLGLEAGVIYVT